MEGLDRYVALLSTWQRRINLVAPSTLADIWVRHIADSVHLHRTAPAVSHWADLGSGGGLPGIVLAIMNAGRENAVVNLVESNNKKAAFLRAALRETGAAGEVHAARIEASGAVIARAEAVSARALAPLSGLLAMVAPYLAPGVPCYFFKGRQHDEEIALASAHWRFTVIKHASDLHKGSVILEIRDIGPR